MSKPLFGPGGNSDSFNAIKKNTTADAPQWVKDFGLDAYEYEAGRGVPGSVRPLKLWEKTQKRQASVFQFMHPILSRCPRLRRKREKTAQNIFSTVRQHLK